MRLLGHPLHAILVAFPLALLSLTPLWDALAWAGIAGAHWVAYLGMIAGLSIGVLAVVTGFIDFVRAEKSAAVETVALWHAGCALTALCIFAVALVLRSADHTATGWALAVEAVGAIGIGITGWFGGHLVFHHGVAVSGATSGKVSSGKPS